LTRYIPLLSIVVSMVTKLPTFFQILPRENGLYEPIKRTCGKVKSKRTFVVDRRDGVVISNDDMWRPHKGGDG